MPENSWELLRKRLIELKDNYGAVAEFCRKGGLPRQTVEGWLNGETAPGLDRIDEIAAGLGIKPRDLFGGKDLSPAWREIIGEIDREFGSINKPEVGSVLTGIRIVLSALRKQPARLRNRDD